MTHLLHEWFPVICKSALYVGLEALPVLYVAFLKFAKGQEEASTWMLLAISCNAAYHSCIGLRAYFDGSAQRHAAALTETRRSTGNTEFLAKLQKQEQSHKT